MRDGTDHTGAVLAARLALENLLHLYAERVDTGDMEGVGELFENGVVVMPDGTELRGASAVRAGYVAAVVHYDADGTRTAYQRLRTTPRTRHSVANPIFEFDRDVCGADVRCTFTVTQQIADRIEVIVGGRYIDRFEQVESGWRFVRRQILIDQVGDVTHHNAALS
ncbi:MAG: nuclear transport factor 2 family protein [Pseudomonadota bacterium]